MKKSDKIIFNSLAIIGVVIIALFSVWWFQPSHIPNNLNGTLHLFDLLLFALVSYVIWHPIIMQLLSWLIGSNIRPVGHPKPVRGYKVAFVTTFVPQSESIELLHKTLPAMVAANYEHDTWLLDEGNDPQVREVCKQYGVKHYSRHNRTVYNLKDGKYAKKTKGGNHNSWYDTFGNHYDFVAQIDTDFIPEPTFLTKTLGHFNNPKVAFVGTPQIYGNINESFIAKGAAEQTYYFYGPILRGMSGMDSSLLIGANHVIRVAALKSVGHYSAHITEDLLTGMKLHAKGWISVYVPEALAIGEGPSSWQAYFNQQMRWAYGCIDVLFRHNPKLFKTMSNRRRLYYYLIQQHYFTGIAMVVSLLLLGLYFFLGINTADIEPEMFFLLYIPVIVICAVMSSRLQKYNIRPKIEKGLLLAGKAISVAAWPTFFLALIGALRNKRLTYKVTPKGDDKCETQDLFEFKLFIPHFIISTYCLLCLVAATVTQNQSIVMLTWLIITFLIMLIMPFVLVINAMTKAITSFTAFAIRRARHLSRFFEINSIDKGMLPSDVSEKEKYLYSKRGHKTLMLFSFLGFVPAMISLGLFIVNNKSLWPILPFLILMVFYYLVSVTVNLFTKDFDLKIHKLYVAKWKPDHYPSIDIFLPTAGEPLEVLQNTWNGVTSMTHSYAGIIKVYCLDDSARDEVRELAEKFGFTYYVRPDRGHFKKAGNLRYGYKHSDGEFIAIFDADFKPRHDFLSELLPYFYLDTSTGIVQSPQYFDVHSRQNWLERGAGAVQELFYRFSQVSRQNFDSAICVGSNAVYRRKALDSVGGTALIEHSEDVHTGFNLRTQGWNLRYIPVILAKGLCPSNMTAFFKQQYRWCRGSMSLLQSKKFWKTKLSFRARLSYFSGFLYYISTAINSLFLPVIPLLVLFFFADKITINHYLLVLPSFIFAFVIFPIWHNAIYGVEAWAVRSVYGWAHLFAVVDTIIGKSMAWKPTGAKVGKDTRYIMFRVMQFIFNFIPSIVWVTLAAERLVVSQNKILYIPLLISGAHYFFVCLKVTLYSKPSEPKPEKRTTKKKNILQSPALS